ncbi:MAG TPA: 2-succinyl-5-enolpyruvyl-6-hydroxy-3-cyclohexene-1-carboxylic-acid synthase [Acidimicrobiales bacterium]|nr:2-succinyl-5-enolpyruvyl-6-hydroxy-3-cyclohexene-1-carboxylic-acid synthase [Acidimicrobiales bacterium]
MTVAATFCATLADEWVRAGITHAVIAPGSRSTPIALALAEREEISVRVVLDERSAGFVALGLGMATGVPAVVVTTSGTAVAELLPAVVEAHHARVPLVVVSADRPWESLAVRAPQTIDQPALFRGLTRFSADPGVPDDAARHAWRSLASRAAVDAQHHPLGPGPVHLNLAFREPLLGTADGLPSSRAAGAPWHSFDSAPVGLSPLPVDGARGLVVAGAGSPSAGALHALGWPVLADPRSHARVDHPLTVAAADELLRVAGFADAHVPDTVLHVGEPWASRVLNEWLAASGAHHIVVDPHGVWPDPNRVAGKLVRGPVAPVAKTPPDQAWVESWRNAERAAQRAIDAVLCLDDHVMSEPAFVRRLVRDLPDGTTLFVASSMPIRHVEWLGAPRTGLRVVANRGANGIDGLISTATGLALGGAAPVVALLGDLAFLHDIGGLRAAAGVEGLRYLVVDNGGGAIFEFLPQAEQLDADVFERLFTTPHGLDVAALATGAPGVDIEVVRTNSAASVAAYRAIHSAVARELPTT